MLSGYYQWGSTVVARGYFNAGNAASSTGSPDTNIWALRARLEWDDFADRAGLRLNPYGEVSYARANMDAYSEAGRAFPAHFDSRTDDATDLRIGVHGAYPLALGNRTALIGLAEGVHRFQGEASAVSGKLLGPGGFSFNFDGPSYDQNWFRAGIGVESTIAGGKAFFMVNGATRGETPSVWVSARYQLAF
ncbi:MAG: autotransporter outer membrane beta-barrel domain-containing protein [Candidatus Accumulibacter sp.]|uniref:Autotransporter outer membrane beta-barrel domain-containing protein n=1 Tax=Candidatus Accumulibacter proximus TaxID=2954385 RepID=A0A935PX52_9PROT|nr:autotransporter outer membrane beta-barrel domain-containing protein [Candidatus Accumulibacter proximus]